MSHLSPLGLPAELLGVMERVSARLQLPWEHMREGTAHSRLDEWFLSDHDPPAPMSLPFLPDLHSEIEKAWKNPYSAHIHRYQHANDANVEGMREHGYMSMTPLARRLQTISRFGGIDSEGSGPAFKTL